MSAVTGLERALQKTYHWLDELGSELGWDDRLHCYAALRAVLHALRDRLGVDEAADLAAQLPLLVRGIYYEGWNPSGTPQRIRHKEEFLEPIRKALAGETGSEPEEAARAVFALLARHLSAGEMLDVVGVLPAEIRELFPPALLGSWREGQELATARA